MWDREIFGTDVYHLIACFIIYSMLGWLLESVYLSICNRKLTNTGFAFSPFCPIYGIGAVTGYLLLRPLSDNIVGLYLAGALSATVFEFLVGKLMLHLFGELWWDYKDKPLNYKGIICVESTIAWGFYAIGITLFLNGFLIDLIDRYDTRKGIMLCRIILIVFFIDFTYHLLQALGINIKEYRRQLKEKYRSFRFKI